MTLDTGTAPLGGEKALRTQHLTLGQTYSQWLHGGHWTGPHGVA